MRRMDGVSAFLYHQEQSGAIMHTLKISIMDTSAIPGGWNYELFRNSGLEGDAVIKIDGLDNANPSLSSHTVDLTVDGVLGRRYLFLVRALNYTGSTYSISTAVALASLPAKPSSPPVSDPSIIDELISLCLQRAISC